MGRLRQEYDRQVAVVDAVPLPEPQLASGSALELDELWMRTRAGRTELQVVRAADTGVSLGSFDSWAAVIDRTWQLGAQAPLHPVSDGDAATVAGIALVYGRGAPHQLCVFHLLREYCGTWGKPVLRRLSGCCGRKVRRRYGNGRGG